MLGRFIMLFTANFIALLILADMGKELKEWAEKKVMREKQEEEEEMRKIVLETLKRCGKQ